MQFGGEKGGGWLEQEGSLEALHSSSHSTDENEPGKARRLGQAAMTGSRHSSVRLPCFHCGLLHLPALPWDQEWRPQPWLLPRALLPLT